MRTVLRLVVPILAVLALLSAAQSDDVKILLQSAPSASKYPNAGFINLVDEARYTIKPNGHWISVTRYAAKICNERGRGIANVHLEYNSSFEKIKIVHARTIKKDGSVINVKPESIQEISPYSGYAMYSSVKAKVMVMPAVENDCIIDYEYEISGNHTIMPSNFWNSWYFQSQEPTMISRFTLQVPSNRGFNQAFYNDKITPTVTPSSDGKMKTYVWESRNLGEIDAEPYMPALSELCPWFEISSIGSWNDVAAWYWKLIEPRIKSAPEIEKAVASLTKGKNTDAEKAKTIFYWVEDKIRYVGLEFGSGAYEPHSAVDVFKNRYGDCKDQTTLLVAMLRAAGIKAYPVLVPVGFCGQTSRRLPSPGIFDHAIAVAEIGGERVWMDATAEVCPFGDLPEADRGREVLVISETSGEFAQTPMYASEENMTSQTSKITLGPDGGIDASVTWTSKGASDLESRITYKYARPNKIKEGLEATAAAISPDAELKEYSTTDPSDRDDPLEITCAFHASGWANRTSKLLIFRPNLQQSVLSQTPFSKAERKFDIHFYGPSSNTSETEILLPQGFKVDEMPQNVSLKTEFASYDRACTLSDGTMKVVEVLIRKSARIPASRYQEVRKFYEDVIQAQKQQAVLRLEG
jgi:hypothetical protein